MNVLSLQSSVALGHVGNSAAVPALHSLGHEAWAIATVVFSNHPGHGGFRGRVTPAQEITELVEGLRERGALASCDAVLSGYLGAAEQGPSVLEAVTTVKAANPDALYALDPVIGDGGRIYVKPGVAEFLRDAALGAADIVTPNAFELEYLSGASLHDTPTARTAIGILRERLGGGARHDGPLVVATGLRLADQPTGTVAMIAADETGTWQIIHPAIDHPAHGAGDLFAALLLGHLLQGRAMAEATATAAASVYTIIGRTAQANSKDLLMIAERAALNAPTKIIPALRLA